MGRACSAASYGTPRAPVEAALAAGEDVVFDIDWQGFRQLRAALPEDVVGRVHPAAVARGAGSAGCGPARGDDEAEIARRMAARARKCHWPEFDHVLVNEMLERCGRGGARRPACSAPGERSPSRVAAIPGAASVTNLAALRRDYARRMLDIAGVADPPLEAAFARVPREDFLPREPWTLLDVPHSATTLAENDPALVYDDVLVVLDRDKGLNNGSPSLHALMLHHLGVAPGDRVLHVGAGAGYYTAILAEMAGPDGAVTAIEFEPRLAAAAQANLGPWPNATVIAGDGGAFPQAATERIYVNFAVADPVALWLDHLPVGGTLVFPLGAPSPSRPDEGSRSAGGVVLKITRTATGYEARHLTGCSFVFASGIVAGTTAHQEVLYAAFRRGGVEFVRSLRRGPNPPPERCWFWSPAWSLSYDPPHGA